jgi:hypothetical protein
MFAYWSSPNRAVTSPRTSARALSAVRQRSVVRDLIAQSRHRHRSGPPAGVQDGLADRPFRTKGARTEIAALEVAAPRDGSPGHRPGHRGVRRGGGQRRHSARLFLYMARALRIVDGPDAVHRRSIAREELDRPRPYVGWRFIDPATVVVGRGDLRLRNPSAEVVPRTRQHRCPQGQRCRRVSRMWCRTRSTRAGGPVVVRVVIRPAIAVPVVVIIAVRRPRRGGVGRRGSGELLLQSRKVGVR